MENRIKNYNYQSIDQSLLAPYYKKICSFIIQFIPLYVSPNILTLIGLAGVLVSTFIVTFLKNTFEFFTICALCSLLLFFYQIMDTLDGMQGRKVGMYYNPTTELFDHGCDSITTFCTVYNFLNLTEIANNYQIVSIWIAVLSLTNFYMSTWEHSNTGIMHFRKGFLNPTEAIFMVKILYLIIGLFPDFQYDYRANIIILCGLLLTSFFGFYQSYSNTILNSKKENYNTFISLTPLIICYVQAIYITVNNIFTINYMNIVLPMLISILNLIWYEISGNNYRIIPYLLVLIANLTFSYMGAYISIIIYIILFIEYTTIMCNILGMKYFYTIPNSQPENIKKNEI